MTADPSRARMWWSAVAVLAVALAVWCFVEWRSAPPPPPQVVLPDAAIR